MFSCSNFRAGLRSRPPFAVFTICILALSFSTLFLGFFVKMSENSLKNPDVITWNLLLGGISGIEYCLKALPPPSQNSSLVIRESENASAQISIPLLRSEFAPVPWNIAFGKKSGSIRGEIPLHMLKTLKKYLLYKYEDSPHLSIGFSISQEGELSCLTVWAPSSVVEDLNLLPSSCSSPLNNVSEETLLTFYPNESFSEEESTCGSDERLILTFESDPNWDLYLSDEDRDSIYAHLMVTTVFLFVVAASVIAVAFIKGAGGRDNYKFSSERGDMELLRSDSPPPR